MHKRLPPKPLNVMERRVPKNDKYAHVQGVLDTGMTVGKVKIISSSEYARRRDETFFRLSRQQLSALYEEYEADEYESIVETSGGERGSPKIVTYREDARSMYSKPYLILDVRDKASFERGHLLQARSFPSTLLRRDQIPPELHTFRNKPGNLIILYCDDEKDSREAAKTFVDRGTDNIFLLTGGMVEFAVDFPFYIEGEVPVVSSPSKPKTARPPLGRIPEGKAIEYGSPDRRSVRGGESDAGSASPSSVRPSGGITHRSSRRSPGAATMEASGIRGLMPGDRLKGSNFGKSARSRDDRSDSGMSTASNMSVAESVISRSMSRKGRL